jgi:hypothetical protein
MNDFGCYNGFAMNEQQPNPKSGSASDTDRSMESPDTAVTADPPSNRNADPGELAKLKKLTAEEQMALYEKELKENDWGHQPC